MPVDGAAPAQQPAALALARTRRLASGALVLMAATYVATHFLPDVALVGLLRSMAEAGMVGGLADWFAVEALFRHPLGIPIPHTALLPRNQARAARNVGRFFETHFLEPASLRNRLSEIQLGRHACDWLMKPANADLVAREVTGLVGHVLQYDPPRRTLARSRRWLRQQVLETQADDALAEALARLVKEGARSTVIGEVLGLVSRAIDQNRDVATVLVQDQSRWWISSAVDRRIAGLVVDGVLSLLEELQHEDSELRREFEIAFDRMVDAMAAEGTLTRAVGEGRNALLRTGTLETTAFQLAEGLRNRLRDRIATDAGMIATPASEMIQEFATRTRSDEQARTALDQRIASIGAKVIGDLRPAISDYVADVIANWEPEELNTRFEEEIGPDLQYIRVNGAVLGSLIGGVLFFVELLAG